MHARAREPGVRLSGTAVATMADLMQADGPLLVPRREKHSVFKKKKKRVHLYAL